MKKKRYSFPHLSIYLFLIHQWTMFMEVLSDRAKPIVSPSERNVSHMTIINDLALVSLLHIRHGGRRDTNNGKMNC